MSVAHVDVLIVGAGISGICAAYYVQTRCPTQSYAIIESRDTLGGTWDLFRYPGVRSDSDMYTLGYSFRPWESSKAIADGHAIWDYLRETARVYGIDTKIHFQQRLRLARWSSAEALWTVEVEQGPERAITTLTCRFLIMCTGYYDYDHGYTPHWPGMDRFQGRIIHPQQWPEGLDYTGKRVVVIGSGATAVTLVPAMAPLAAHVTMVQRSPTYIVARPWQDGTDAALHRILPARLTYKIVRIKSILFGMYIYALSRWRPTLVRNTILKRIRQQLGPDYPVERDFSPAYDPWDQRLCLVPDGDLFQAMKGGKASVVTGQIAAFTETGLSMASGQEVPADVIITATGLNMHLMSGVQLVIDDTPVALGQTLSYRGMMYSGVPNLASLFGYVNASWTLKCELIMHYLCRLLNYMQRRHYAACLPNPPAGMQHGQPMIPLSSGYVQRAQAAWPHQGTRRPWHTYQNYARDLINFRMSRLNDGTLQFIRHRESAS